MNRNQKARSCQKQQGQFARTIISNISKFAGRRPPYDCPPGHREAPAIKKLDLLIFLSVLLLGAILIGLRSSQPAIAQENNPAAQAGGIAQVWANEGGDKVWQSELRATDDPDNVLNSVWDGETLSLFGARNEVLSFNLVLEAPTTDATDVTVFLTELTGPNGTSLTTQPAGGDDLFDYVGRNIELFYVRYLEIKGLSVDLAYGDYDERHIPARCRRPHDEEFGEGRGSWADRPCHNRLYPEIAVPLELHTPFTIAAGTNQSIWGDLYIPQTAPAGLYTGAVTVTEGGATTWQIPIRLRVRNFTLPDLPSARTMLYYSRENINDRYLGEPEPEAETAAYTQSLELADRHFQLAHRHKISLIDSYTEIDQLDEAWTARLNGELFTASRGYDGVGVRVGNNVYAIGAYGDWPWQEGDQTQMWTNTDAWVNWFDSHAFTTPTDTFLYLIDESDDYPQIEQWAGWMKANPGPGQRLMSLATVDLPAAAAETPSLDIPASAAQFGPTDLWQEAADSYLADPDKQFYMYNGRRPASGSFAIEDDGVALRELAWGQYKMGIDRWFYWESTYYNNYQCYGEDDPAGQTNLFQQAQTFGCDEEENDSLGRAGWNYFNGDGVLFYPGTDSRYPEDSYGVMGPFASLRLKQWRRGIQDVDYLTLAGQIDPERTADIVNQMIPKVLWEYGVEEPEDPTWILADISWPTDPDEWEAARAELAEIIEAGAAAEPPSGDKMSLWEIDTGPHLRGANIWQRVVVPELDGDEFLGNDYVGPPYTQADFDRLAALGANYVNISHPGLFTEKPPYVLDEKVQENLDRLLGMIAQADMFAVITFRTGPGRSDFTFYRDGAGDWFDESLLIESVWTDPAAQDGWVEMWRATAERYRDNPVVAGYDLMCEPNSAGALLGIWEPDEFYDQYADTLYNWNQLYPRLTDAIREVDPDTPILIGGMGWSSVRWLPFLEPTGDPRTVYMVHQYEPQDQYTHQEPPAKNGYPGQLDLNWDGEPDPFDRDWLDGYLSPIDRFRASHDRPVAVNEFGVERWVPGGAEFMDDQMDLFEDRGLNHALWVWNPAWEPYTEEVNAFDFRFGPDPANTDPVSNDLVEVITGYWERNTVRPSDFIGPTGARERSPSEARLAGVDRWLYLIDVNLEPEMVDRMAASEYDMIVLDFIPSEENNTDYPMADVISQLHTAPHPKLVIAYIDIGQAESYRTYWQPDWGIGNPDWIAGADPDGWEGNFPVAFWREEWQEIWLGPAGYLQAILEAGFDGVYLDWVEAYSDENVIALAEQEDVEPRQEMITWVGEIADFGRDQQEEFIVIGQNGAELAQSDDYLTSIDAIAQEQVWFDGSADNDPPGDCPLPRTEAEVETGAYRDTLSPACREQYDQYPNSTLHVSSEEYLHYLTLARDQGELIFTVDYALDPENVAWIYETSRALGFVPFAGSRALDRYVEPR